MKKLSATLKKDPVEIDSKEFYVREMSGKDRDSFLEMMEARREDVPEVVDGALKKVKRVTKMSGLFVEVVSMTLFEKDGDKPVSKETIQNWPASTVESLFDMADSLNGLTEKANKSKESEAKNASPASAEIGTGSP